MATCVWERFWIHLEKITRFCFYGTFIPNSFKDKFLVKNMTVVTKKQQKNVV